MTEYYIGLMSGTSMDSIDAVLVDLSTAQPQLVHHHHHPWPPQLQTQLRAIAQGQCLTAAKLAQLDAATGHSFAAAANQLTANIDKTQIQAIGSHGQTVAHDPTATPGYTLQLGNPNVIAEQTGITTIADFRGRDIAAGGQGAPLVPAFHQAVLRSNQENRVILNIGGIANITWLPRSTNQPTTGFDTGPGNCLLDAWVQQHTDQPYDQDGHFAQQGHCQPRLLQHLLQDPYFTAAPPKSTGTHYFSLHWLQQHLANPAYRSEDIQATLVALTAHSIAQAIQRYHPSVNRLLVCGGGWHNPALMAALRTQLSCPMTSTADAGLDPDWVEAIAFAWLAQQRLRQRPGNLATVTGAQGLRPLGGIYAH